MIKESHCCRHGGCVIDIDKVMIEATQMAQDAQAAYACDDCIKRQPMAFNGVKECCKGCSILAEHIRQEPLQRQGTRHATRMMCDAYGKGIVRGQVENANVRAYSRTHDVTAAESIKTCLTEHCFDQNDVDMVQRLNDTHDKHVADRSSLFAEVDLRSKI